MLRPHITALIFAFAAIGANDAVSDGACTARNEHGDTCSTSCSTGERAVCTNAQGENPPICECRVAP
jgi:hypothetical protein